MAEPPTMPQMPTGAGDTPAMTPDPARLPERFGRYRITAVLGTGGCGVVYRGYDEELRRDVAVKVPHRHRVGTPELVELYLAEARALADLDHPAIVPVYDLGHTDDGLCYVISKFIAGCDLRARLERGPLPPAEAVALAARIADALHHAHRRGLVHRDVKPGNILLDAAGVPYLADFGLALRDEDYGKGPQVTGTPAYMSPEQARGEGHLVDARSDVYSLGVVLYELLTGLRPFRAAAAAELVEQIKSREPKPPRQLNEAVRRELDRACLRALAKRAADFAEDLRHWLAGETAVQRAAEAPAAPATAPSTPPAPPSQSTTPAESGHGLLRVVPRGLRSFEAGDADFFLALLPGPRDRDGLPDSIRFWKALVESVNEEQPVRVGLLYGPSGCGKSSLVKAGLLPRLAESVVSVYVEAAAGETEARLRRRLRRLPGVPQDLGLAETLAWVRRHGLPRPGARLLIVLDQLEQWLHAWRGEDDAELVEALRQCDGERVQALLLVRDDFWMAATRFLHALDVRLAEGQNSAAVDLFDPRHARRVLAAFGRAYGALPEGEPGAEETRFLDQAVAGLAQDGKIIPVRLSLFAQMVKDKPWKPATLQAVGGAEGVGVTFLEETFSAPTAPPAHRLHQGAARAVLKALLPEPGADLKGHLRGRDELLAASGYGGRPADFDDLMRILDAELRLVTPAEPEAVADSPSLAVGAGQHPSYYQLTHDYLVPVLRQWLTRKQRETSRGRAELRLADRAALWTARPEGRNLPAWWEWASIRLLTRSPEWTVPERRMMRQADRHHLMRAAGMAVVLLLLAGVVWYVHGALQAEARVQNLLTAETRDVPGLIKGLTPYRHWAEPLLRRHAGEDETDPKRRLHAALALAGGDPGQVEYLLARLQTAPGPEEVQIIRGALRPYGPQVAERLWPILCDPQTDESARLRAACAVAACDPENPDWAEAGRHVARRLAAEPLLSLGQWADLLRPVRAALAPPLMGLLADADPARYPALLVLARAYPDEARAALRWQLDQAGPPAEREALARRRANVAVALLLLGDDEHVWPLLRFRDDPTLRSFLIDRLSPLGADPLAIARRLGEETDVSARRALILCLGEFADDRWGPGVQAPLIDRLQRTYHDDPDAGIHAAAGWLLRRWGQADRLRRIDEELASPLPLGGRRWYVNRQGQTLVVLDAPGVVWMGSPDDEPGRGDDETRHRRRIDRSFAVSAELVTIAAYQSFQPDPQRDKLGTRVPANRLTWYDAARYCRWLSEQEGVREEEMCYPKIEHIKPGMRMQPGYLRRTGYRLPTEAEWEYACRAGTVTPWSFGGAEELMNKYGWTNAVRQRRLWPTGLLKPNDFGLFDMHGDIWEWCQDEYRPYPAADGGVIEDGEDLGEVRDDSIRIWRAGAFHHPPALARSASRGQGMPADVVFDAGFRVVRTLR